MAETPGALAESSGFYSDLSHHMVTLFTEPMGVRDPDVIHSFHSDSRD